MSIQEIIEATKTLSQVERIELTRHLMVDNGIELQSLLDHSFLAELDRRVAEYDADPSIGIDADDVIQDAMEYIDMASRPKIVA